MHLVEFSYNNHYQSSAKLSPFEILYGRKCNTPITWWNPVDILMLGPDLSKELELTVKHVQSNLKTTHDRQKGHADLKRTQKEFQVGEHVFVKVKPIKYPLSWGVVLN